MAGILSGEVIERTPPHRERWNVWWRKTSWWVACTPSYRTVSRAAQGALHRCSSWILGFVCRSFKPQASQTRFGPCHFQACNWLSSHCFWPLPFSYAPCLEAWSGPPQSDWGFELVGLLGERKIVCPRRLMCAMILAWRASLSFTSATALRCNVEGGSKVTAHLIPNVICLSPPKLVLPRPFCWRRSPAA